MFPILYGHKLIASNTVFLFIKYQILHLDVRVPPDYPLIKKNRTEYLSKLTIIIRLHDTSGATHSYRKLLSVERHPLSQVFYKVVKLLTLTIHYLLIV